MLKYTIIALFALLISAYYNYSSHPEIPVSRRCLLFVLRSISLGILLLLIISPILYYVQNKDLSQQIVILKDTSASMDLKHGNLSKLARLNKAISSMKNTFSQAGYEISEYGFANGLRGSNDSSLLTESIVQLSNEKTINNLAGIVIASDAWFRDESLASIGQLGVPFYVLADSSSSPIADIEVVKVLSNRYAYRNEPNAIRAEVLAQNYNGEAEARLMISGNLVSRKRLKLASGVPQSVDFVHRFNQTGFFKWDVQLQQLSNESRISNNSFPGAIEVLADKERIMIISDRPAWDNKFILDAIATNPRWEVESYQSRDGSLYSGEQAVGTPKSDNLSAIVIINNGALRLSGTALQFVSSNHAKGVGLMYQGLPVTELGNVLPLVKSNIISPYQGFINPSASAVNYPMLSPISDGFRDIPPIDYFYVNAAAGAEVLATINNPQNSPAIAVKNITGTRSIAIASLNIWRWQLQSKDEGYNKLISNCITWLGNKSTGGFDAIYNSSYMLGEEIRIKLRLEDEIRQRKLDASPKIRISNSKNKEVLHDYLPFDNGEYNYKAELSEPDTYTFSITDAASGKSTSGKFVLSESSLEKRDFGYNLPLLHWLATHTKGKLVWENEVLDFTAVPAVKETQILRREIALYKKWYILSLFILAFCVELYLRRRWGLL